MKKILLALTMVGIVHFSATAQNKSRQNYNENYAVCRVNNAYTICNESPTSATMTPAGGNEDENTVTPAAETTPAMQSEHTDVYPGNYQHRNISVNYDDPLNPYEGLPSIQDDGPKKNEERNLNTNQTSIILPPVNGENGNR